MEYMKTGTITGTGADLTVSLGFTPSFVLLYKKERQQFAVYTKEMANDAMVSQDTVSDGLIIKPTLSMGSTPNKVAHTAAHIQIAGVKKAIAASAAGVVIEATTIPQNKWGLFGLQVPIGGTVVKGCDAADNATGYNTEALAIAALAAPSADNILVGYVTVICTEAAGFVGATTNFNATGVTANFYSGTLLSNKTTNGITPLEQANNSVLGFALGADSVLNASGEIIYYVAGR